MHWAFQAPFGVAQRQEKTPGGIVNGGRESRVKVDETAAISPETSARRVNLAGYAATPEQVVRLM